MATYKQALPDELSAIWAEETRHCRDKCHDKSSEELSDNGAEVSSFHHHKQTAAAAPLDLEDIRDYVTKTTKYLYDGKNLIKIKEKRASALLADLARADTLRKNVQSTMKGDGLNCKFHGFLWDFVTPDNQLGVPWIVHAIIRELEGRGKRLLEGLYLKRVDREEVSQMKWRFKKEGTPKV